MRLKECLISNRAQVKLETQSNLEEKLNVSKNLKLENAYSKAVLLKLAKDTQFKKVYFNLKDIANMH